MKKTAQAPPRVAIEEEYQLVDRKTGGLRPVCNEVMEALGDLSDCEADIQHELHLSQIEMASPICNSLQDVQRTLSATRSRLIHAVRQVGAELIAAGTHPMPLPEDDDLTPKARYRSMADRYQQLARNLIIFGCHVHVDMPDRALGVETMNRVTPWLPALQALTANSPFWRGTDTGYASYRRELWVQWPMAGPPIWFEDLAAHDACVDQLIQSEAIEDATRIYWDVRLPQRVPTIEFRVMDVLTRIEDAVAITGLIRALVQQVHDDIRSNIESPPVRPETMRVALWQAARYGVSDHLLDPMSCRQCLASEHIHALLDYVRAPLERSGDFEQVSRTICHLLEIGGNASRQRQAHCNRDMLGLIHWLAEETAAGTDCEGPILSEPSRWSAVE